MDKHTYMGLDEFGVQQDSMSQLSAHCAATLEDDMVLSERARGMAVRVNELQAEVVAGIPGAMEMLADCTVAAQILSEEADRRIDAAIEEYRERGGHGELSVEETIQHAVMYVLSFVGTRLQQPEAGGISDIHDNLLMLASSLAHHGDVAEVRDVVDRSVRMTRAGFDDDLHPHTERILRRIERTLQSDSGVES